MKICQVQLTYYPDMSRVDIYGYSRALVKLGHNVTVVVARRPDEAPADDQNGVRIIRINATNNTGFLNSLRFYFQARRFLKKEEFDIIHLFNPSLAVTLLSIEGRIIRWPIIFDIRTGPVGKKIRSMLGHILSLIGLLFAKQGIILFEPLKEVIIPKILRQKVSEVPLGADMDIFAEQNRHFDLRKSLGYSNEDIVIVYIGAINQERRIDNVVFAFKRAQLEEQRLRLLLIGGGTAEKIISRLIKKNNLSDLVQFIPPIPHDQIPHYLSSANIGLSYIPLVPQFQYQPPLKTVEYLAANLPTIATKTEGNKLFLKDFPYLLIDDSIKSLANALVWVAKNEKKLKKIDFRSSVTQFDWKKICKDRLFPVYQKVVQGTSHKV